MKVKANDGISRQLASIKKSIGTLSLDIAKATGNVTPVKLTKRQLLRLVAFVATGIAIQPPRMGRSSIPPSLQPSASGTTIPSATQLVDGSLNLWTLSGGVVYENDATAGSTSGVILLLYHNGAIYQQTSVGWWSWTGNAWASVAGDPRSGPTGSPYIIDTDWTYFNAFEQQTPTAIPFWASTSPWNVGDLTRVSSPDQVTPTDHNFFTRITLYPNNFPNCTTVEWAFPERAAPGHVYCYDRIVMGKTSDHAFIDTVPYCQIQDLTTLTATHNATYSSEAEGAYHNIIYDFFTYSTVPGDYNNSQNEFSISLHCQSYEASAVAGLPAANKFNFTDSQGTEWICYTYATPAIGAKGNQIVFDRADYSDCLNYTVDIKAMLQACVDHGWALGTDYFAGTAIGAEPAQGTGQWTLNSWSLSYNGTTYP